MVESLASSLAEDLNAFRRDLNAVLTRGTWRLFAIARKEYRQTLDEHAVVDFPEALARALELLGAMGEFTASRFQLESRYQHLLLDEFQDTSDAQWRLVWQLVQSWREGLGVAQDQPLEPTIFVVGDRKQSIYGFRDADVGVLRRAAGRIAELRPDGAPVRRAIRQSFRAVPPLLAFTNALCDAITTVSRRECRRGSSHAFRAPRRLHLRGDRSLPDRRLAPVVRRSRARSRSPRPTPSTRRAPSRRKSRACSPRVPSAIARPAWHGRSVPGDIAILFRSREGHQQFESSLEAEGIPSYVYKGLGFFDTDEVKDVVAVLRWLGDPSSSLRAAAFLRSRVVRCPIARCRCSLLISRPPSRRPWTATAVSMRTMRPCSPRCGRSRRDGSCWPIGCLQRSCWIACSRNRRTTTSSQGPRAVQARENLKKIRTLVRRIQNRGYATLARVTEHLDRLSAATNRTRRSTP
jgi:ATP-dependent exoDNAse (exonuclease V) beta subunit